MSTDKAGFPAREAGLAHVPEKGGGSMTQRRMGGFTVIARELTEVRGKLVTRQGVYMWWSRKDRNGFPDRQPVTTKTGATRMLFDIDEVTAWYDAYVLLPWQGRKK